MLIRHVRRNGKKEGGKEVGKEGRKEGTRVEELEEPTKIRHRKVSIKIAKLGRNQLYFTSGRSQISAGSGWEVRR